MAKPYVVVVGGTNMDIAGRPTSALVPRDSNPGTVRLSPGGVGRNIAHNLALLGVCVKLVTAFGEDAHAEPLIEGCRAAGIDVAHSIVVPGGATSTYLYVTDEQGDMQVAINDMAILEHITPKRLEQRLDLLQDAALCVLDTNLPTDTINWICNTVHVPLYCDPISIAKAGRVGSAVGRLHTLKPNLREAELLSKMPIHGKQDLNVAAHRLLDTGLGRVFVSLGERGVYCADHQTSELLPSLATHVAGTNGAGDAMVAGLVWAHLEGLDLVESAQAGLAAAAIAVESEHTINPQLSATLLRRRIQPSNAILWD